MLQFDPDSRSTETLYADGVGLSIRRHGSGPPVLCLHATGHGARDFDRLSERLGHTFEFIAVDWPGQGESKADHAAASARRYAQLLKMIIDELGFEKILLLGNSIGGAAAIEYAAAYPQRVIGLILCNSGGLVPVNWITRLAIRQKQRRFARAAADPTFPRWFDRYYRSVLQQPDAAWRRAAIVADGPRTAPVLAQAWASFAQPEADIRHLVPQLTMPILYAWGKHDRTIPWFLAKRAALKAPDARVAMFACGHSPFLEQPEAFGAAFAKFARACFSDGT